MRTVALFLTVVPMLGSWAAAAVISTAPIRVPHLENLDCTIRNVGKKEISVADIRGEFLGIAPSTSGGSTLAPGGVTSVIATNATGGATLGWCEFEFKGGKRAVRATACRLDATLGCVAPVPAN